MTAVLAHLYLGQIASLGLSREDSMKALPGVSLLVRLTYWCCPHSRMGLTLYKLDICCWEMVSTHLVLQAVKTDPFSFLCPRGLSETQPLPWTVELRALVFGLP